MTRAMLVLPKEANLTLEKYNCNSFSKTTCYLTNNENNTVHLVQNALVLKVD